LVRGADGGTAKATEAVSRAVDLEAARHGAVSFPLSVHALRAWVTRRGGAALHPSHTPRYLHIAGFLLGTRARGWRHTRLAYEKAMASGGPDALYRERRDLSTMAEPSPPRALVSLMRRCGPDPRVAAECVRPL